MKRWHPCTYLLNGVKCCLCSVTVLMPAKNYNLWHKCHNCFDCGCWCLTSPSVLCTMYLQWPAAGARNQLQWETLIERVCSVYGYHVSASSATSHFCKCHNDLYRFLKRFPTAYTYTVSNNAQVNIIFCDYTVGMAVLWCEAQLSSAPCSEECIITVNNVLRVTFCFFL